MKTLKEHLTESTNKDKLDFDNPFTSQKAKQITNKLKNGANAFYKEIMRNISLRDLNDDKQIYFERRAQELSDKADKESKYLIPLIDKIPKTKDNAQFKNITSQIQKYIEKEGITHDEVDGLFDRFIKDIGGRPGHADWMYPKFIRILEQIMRLIVGEDWEWDWY